VVISDALQLEAARRRTCRFFSLYEAHNTNSTIPQRIFQQSVSICQHIRKKIALHMCQNCYFRASDQNSDIAVEFGDVDFLYGTNIILAIG